MIGRDIPALLINGRLRVRVRSKNHRVVPPGSELLGVKSPDVSEIFAPVDEDVVNLP